MQNILYVLSAAYQAGRRSDAVCGLLPASADQRSAQRLNTIIVTSTLVSAPQAPRTVPFLCQQNLLQAVCCGVCRISGRPLQQQIDIRHQ
jgi:hypothetical protein